MAEPTLHITFTESGAMELSKVFASLGMDATAIAPFDDLTYGPIRDATAQDRVAWVDEVLGYDDEAPSEWAAQIEAFWSAAVNADDDAVVWYSDRVARESAGVMRLLTLRDGAPLRVVDLTEFRTPRGTPSTALGLFSEGLLAETRLWEGARLVNESDCRDRVEAWRSLEAENAPLRVIQAGRLASAPLTFFDSLILGIAEREWRTMAQIVGEAMCDSVDREGLYQVGDLLLASRARALADGGQLEWRGDLSIMRGCEVRRAAR